MEERPNNINIKNIRVAMARRGLNQTQLAENSGLSRATVNDALNSGRVGTNDAVIAIARALGLTPNDILVGWEDPDENLATPPATSEPAGELAPA